LTPTGQQTIFLAGRYDLLLAPFGYGERIAAFVTLCPNERVSNASPDTPRVVQAKDQAMRDFRDAKVMAHTLRSALATKGLNITVSQSLELIAEAFGVADWNTVSATIWREAAGSGNNAHSPQFPTTATMHPALAYAIQRKHQYETLEHLLLALIDDVDASAVMKACKVDLGALISANGSIEHPLHSDVDAIVLRPR
jgi:hypothetical protein